MFSQTLSAFITAGAASLVEFIEALTVVLAVGAGRGWRSAFAGAAGALVLLLLLALLFGPALATIPLGPAKFVIGTLILLFGLRWLRKATRRAAGIIPLRDEEEAFRRHSARVGHTETRVPRWDRIGLLAAFQATAIEGLEVIFIVVAVGAGGTGLMRPAAFGAAAALAAVVALGALLHRPITRVPENTLKRVVGAMLAGLGTFWIGDGAGLPASLGGFSRSSPPRPRCGDAMMRGVAILRRCMTELVGLFVDDGIHTAFIVAWIVLACATFRYVIHGLWSGPLLFLGVGIIFVATTTGSPRSSTVGVNRSTASGNSASAAARDFGKPTA